MFHLVPEYELGQILTIWEWGIILKTISITSIPYHLFQSGATGKSIAPDSRHGITYDKVF